MNGVFFKTNDLTLTLKCLYDYGHLCIVNYDGYGIITSATCCETYFCWYDGRIGILNSYLISFSIRLSGIIGASISTVVSLIIFGTIIHIAVT